jgi:hypothetical protein
MSGSFLLCKKLLTFTPIGCIIMVSTEYVENANRQRKEIDYEELCTTWNW